MKSIIGDELDKVAVVLKELNKQSKVLSDLVKENGVYENYDNLLDSLKDLYVYYDEENERKNQAGKMDQKLDNLNRELINLEKEINNLKKSNLFKEKQKLEEKKDQLNADEYNLRNKFKMRFYFLERPLKKYQKIEKNKILKSYLDDSFNSFIKDKDYHIVEILKGLKKVIKEKKIDLKNSEKVIKQINDFTKDWLKSIRSELNFISQERKEVNESLKKNNYEEKLNHLLSRFKKIQLKISELSEKKIKLENRNIVQYVFIIRNFFS